MLNILQKESEILHKVSQEIKLNDISSTKIQNLIKKMKETLDNQEDGAALAAPQIGESIRLFIISDKIFDENKKTNLVYINPKIIKQSKQQTYMGEGCLSVLGIFGKVKRLNKCTIQAYDEKGQIFTRGGSELLSQIFQHEIDHLNGILFIEKAKDLETIQNKNSKL